MVGAISIRSVGTEQDFLALRSEWNDLLRRSPIDSVFLRHEWFEAAWEWWRSDCQLHILCAYRDQDLVGICPLVCRAYDMGAIRVRAVKFLTVPDSQMIDFIGPTTDRHAVCEAVVAYLVDNRCDWELIELEKIPTESDTLAPLLNALSKRGVLATVYDDGSNPGIDLTDTWQSYYSRRSRRLKKGNNLVRNRLERAHQNIELKRCSEKNIEHIDVNQCLGQLINISSKSWKKDTGLTLEQPNPNAFIRKLTQRALEQGWLSAWFLWLDGVAVAMEYQLDYHGKIHALRADYDEAFAEQSPGTYLNHELLKLLFESNSKRYLMGPGKNPYKLRWAEEFEPLSRVVGYNTNLKGRLLGITKLKLIPWIKRFQRRGEKLVARGKRDSQ